VTKIGATGHQNIPPEAGPYVTATVREAVRTLHEPRLLFTSLAAGADQLVAEILLEEGGSIHAILPSAGYEDTLQGHDLVSYRNLLARAEEVERLDFPAPSEEAYWAAGQAVVDRCDILIAVWDGLPSRGLGGTADAVRYANQQGKDVRVIWPGGVART
jgi:hypothetical protein